MESRRRRARSGALALAAGTLSLVALTGCGGSLSSNSTCQQYMDASSGSQAKVRNQLAMQFNAPDIATPLGAPNVAYFCASNPSATLAQIMQSGS